MSETRYRANLVSATVDEIVIVNESAMYVDVRYTSALGASVRREAKNTAYTKICRFEQEAWQAIEAYALEQLVLAEQAMRRWKERLAEVETHLAKPADRAGD